MSQAASQPSVWKLWKEVAASYRTHFWRYTLIVLVVALPTTAFTAISQGDATVAAYGALAALFMNAALLYAIITCQAQEKVKLRTFYYNSSIAIVRYVIVGIVLAIMLIPAAFGLSLVGLGGGISEIPSVGEVTLLGIIGLILAIPSIYLIIRNGFALIGVFESGIWPGAALQASRQITQGRFWGLFLRYIGMSLGLLVVALPIAFICIGLFTVSQEPLFLSLYQILNTAIILPLFYLYLYRLYISLGGKHD
jgi:hypothetical protein